MILDCYKICVWRSFLDCYLKFNTNSVFYFSFPEKISPKYCFSHRATSDFVSNSNKTHEK